MNKINKLIAFSMLLTIFTTSINFVAVNSETDSIDLGITEYRAKMSSTYARGDSWSVKYENGVYKWSSEPMWVWDGSNYVPYMFDNQYNTNGYYQVQSGLIAARIYDYYAEFYTPNMSEIRLYDERWEVQQWTGKKWSDIGAQSGKPIFSISADTNNINITKRFTSWAGSLEINYIFKEGMPMKHEVQFTSTLSELTIFRVIQEWAGIVGSNVNEQNIISIAVVKETFFNFKKADWSLSIIESQYNSLGKLEPVVIDVHPSGLQTEFIFSNWTLNQGQYLIIDPDTATFDDPTEDGHIDGFDKSRYNDIDYFKIGDNVATSSGPFRGYIEWDISSIPDSMSITNSIFKYHGKDHPGGDAHIHAMTVQPSTGSNTDIYNDAGDGTVYVDVAGFPVSGANNQVDLGASADYDIGSQLSSNWFALGFQADDESYGDGSRWSSIYAEDYASATPKPTLYVEYTQNAPPNPPTLNSPINGTKFDMVDTVTFSWTFSDPNASDTQSAYQIQLDNDPNFGSPEVDSGKVMSSQESSNQNLPSSIDKFYWHVKTWDNGSAEGPWSANRYVIADRIRVKSISANDTRLNINSKSKLTVELEYEYDQSPITSGSFNLEGNPLTNQGDGSWTRVETRSSVIGVTFDTVTGSVGNLNVVNMNGKSKTVIWDRFKVSKFWASKYDPIVNETVYLYLEGSQEFDEHQPDSDDNLTVEGVDFSWDWVEERFYAPVTKNSSSSITYDELTSFYEHTYNITVGTMNGKSITVIWSESQYNFYGLFWENGTQKGAVNVTAYLIEGSEKFEVNGSLTKQFETQPIMFSYPLSGGGSRCVYTYSNNETFYLFTPVSDYSSYSFTIKDYSGKVGQQNAYLESIINVNQTEKIVERKLIWDTENPTTLILTEGQIYIIQIKISDEEIYRFDYYIPGVSTIQTLTISGISYSDQAHYVGEDVSVEATRPEPTHIRINYKDDLEQTSEIFVEICYINGTQIWNDTSTEQMVQFNWYGAVNTTDYLANLIAKHPFYGDITYSKFLTGEKGEFEPAPDFDAMFGEGAKTAFSIGLIFFAFITCSRVTALIGTIAGVSVASILTFINFIQIPYLIIAGAWTITIMWGLTGGGS